MRANWQNKGQQRLRVLMAIQKRDTKAAIYGQGLYVVMFVSSILAGLVLRNSLLTLRDNDLLVTANPLLTPLLVYVQVLSVYITLSSSISIARDRDKGTLELLLYGPVDYTSYVIGKFSSQLVCYVISIILFLLSVIILSNMLGFIFNLETLYVALFSVTTSGCTAAFGLFLSTVSGNMRISLFMVIGILIFFLGLQGGYMALTGMTIESPDNPLLYVREVVAFIYRLASYVSPFAPLNRGVSAISLEHLGRLAMALVTTVFYIAVMLGLAVFALTKKGIHR